MNVGSVPRMGMKPGVLSASISWWTFKNSKVSLTKIRQAISGTLDKFQIPVQISHQLTFSKYHKYANTFNMSSWSPLLSSRLKSG